ncbi:MAG TPA: hypothetical protein V6D47_04240 [Oscillatoriaceae cyanobacterium]
MPITAQRFNLALARDPYKGSTHGCFRFAWAAVKGAGGKDVNSAKADASYSNEPLSALRSAARSGKLKIGDVIYANRKPGADPSSTNLAYGPHWFVYKGNGKFQDQYGVKTLAEMEAFIPNRKIDTIYHPFGA